MIAERQTKLMPFSASRMLKKGKGAKEQPGNKYDINQDLWFAVLEKQLNTMEKW